MFQMISIQGKNSEANINIWNLLSNLIAFKRKLLPLHASALVMFNNTLRGITAFLIHLYYEYMRIVIYMYTLL